MQFHILSVSGGNFEGKDGRNVNYGSVMCIDDDVTHREGFSGQSVRKIKASPDLIHHIKEQVPGLFDCRIEVVGKDSVVKIIAAKMVNAKVKTS